MRAETSPVVREVQHSSRQQPQQRSGYSMIAVRVVGGMKSHFHIRATEWVMLYPTIWMGVAMIYQDRMFSTSPSFSVLSGWAGENIWALLVLICALLRLGALIVNGTFQGFGISPHLRLFASFAGTLFWSQFCLGLFVAAITSGGAWSAPIAYSTLILMEVLNITRSWSDVIARRR